jgi:hypothetical protein
MNNKLHPSHDPLLKLLSGTHVINDARSHSVALYEPQGG